MCPSGFVFLVLVGAREHVCLLKESTEQRVVRFAEGVGEGQESLSDKKGLTQGTCGEKK